MDVAGLCPAESVAGGFGTLPGFPSEANVRNAGPDGGAGAGTRPRPSSHAAPRAARTRDSRKAAVVSAGVTGESWQGRASKGRRFLGFDGLARTALTK